MKVAITYNLKPKEKEEDKPADYFSEYDSDKTISAICGALRDKGHNVSLVEVSKDLFQHFRKNKYDAVFNIAEGNGRKNRESEVPAILDYLGIPYTGSGVLTLSLALDKAKTKKILQFENIPTPNFQLFTDVDEELDKGLKFPLIVKPNREGSAKGITKESVVEDQAHLYQEIRRIFSLYRQEALVEEFIDGKELTAGVLENGKLDVLPILEIDFSSCSKSGEYFYSWKMKEFQGNTELGFTPQFHCPARVTKDIEDKIKELVIRTHKSIGCFGISRTDIRLDKDNTPYILEINPLPGLDPDESNFPIMAKAAGLKYEELIEFILLTAVEKKCANADNNVTAYAYTKGAIN